MNKEGREKERLEKQKMLVSIPGGKTLEDYLGAAASRNVELPGAVEDLLLMIKGLDDGEIKTRLLQETRVLLDHHKGPRCRFGHPGTERIWSRKSSTRLLRTWTSKTIGP